MSHNRCAVIAVIESEVFDWASDWRHLLTTAVGSADALVDSIRPCRSCILMVSLAAAAAAAEGMHSRTRERVSGMGGLCDWIFSIAAFCSRVSGRRVLLV